MSEHLTSEELERGSLSQERKNLAVRHLIQGCEVCRAVLLEEPCIALMLSRERSPESGSRYDDALDSAFRWADRMQRVFRQQEILYQKAYDLLSSGEGAVAIVGQGNLSLSGLGVYEALLDRSWVVRHESPREMVQLAAVAVQVAQGLDSAIYGQRYVVELQARAWGELGNAYRVADNLAEAERAFGKAFELLDPEDGDPYVRARLHDLHASFLGTLRRFELALDALDIVRNLYLELGEFQLAGRALITKAVYTFYSGRPEDALLLNQEGFDLGGGEPEFLLMFLHNQLLFLEACGRFREARMLLFQKRSLLATTGKVPQLKLRWAEGRISYGLGEVESARLAFATVRQGFQETGQTFARALVTLELAMAVMREGEAGEAERLVDEAASVFTALQMHREVLACVRLLMEAFRLRKATTALLERTITFLREWEINPTLRYDFRLDLL